MFDIYSFVLGVIAFPMTIASIEFGFYVFEFSCNYKKYKEWKKKGD